MPSKGRIMKKLNKAQQDILDKIRSGWELGRYESVGGITFAIQRGGLGRDGEVHPVNIRTAYALIEAGVVEFCAAGFPLTKMRSTNIYWRVSYENTNNPSK